MTTKKYITNPVLLLISVTTTIVLLVLAVVLLILKNYIGTAVFVLISLFFIHESCVYGRLVEVSEQGLKKTFFGKTELEIPWKDVKQVGVAGTRVFMNDFLGGTGTIYIYVAKEEMEEDKVFNMMVDWPPKDKIFLRYDIDRLNIIQTYFSGRIKKYRTGKLKIYNAET